MKKLILFVGLLLAAGYVATNYLAKVGPTVTSDAHIADEIK